MSEFNITVEGGSSIRLPTAGKYCDRDIVVTATGGGGDMSVEDGIINGTLTGEYINDRVTEFRRYVFYRCYDLTRISAPKVLTIGQYALSECTSLVEINFPNASTVGQSVFVGCTSLANAELPAATTLYSNVFKECTALKKLKCNSLKGINALALSGCTNFETLILSANEVCTLANKSAISDTKIAKGTGYIYVPSALIEEYKVASNWSTYAEQFRAIEDYPEICG